MSAQLGDEVRLPRSGAIGQLAAILTAQCRYAVVVDGRRRYCGAVTFLRSHQLVRTVGQLDRADRALLAEDLGMARSHLDRARAGMASVRQRGDDDPGRVRAVQARLGELLREAGI